MMLGIQRGGPGRGRARWGALLALGVAVTGCSTGPLGSSAPSGNQSVTDRFTNLFSSSPSGQEQAKVIGPDPTLDCPTVEIRQGASTLQTTAAGKGADAGSLQYQVTISRTARECALVGATMTIKVGVQGRIILGPAGVPSQIDVPLRLAVVREGVEPKAIWTKFYKLPVTIPTGQSSVPFTYVEENITFPLPALDELAAYLIYVGFDQVAKEPPASKVRVRKKS